MKKLLLTLVIVALAATALVGCTPKTPEEPAERLAFTLISASGSQTRTNMLEIIQNQWRELGIDVNVELFEISVYYDKLDNGEFDIYQWGWNLSPDPDNYIYFHSSSGFDENGILQGFNDVGYSNPEVDELIELARTTFDQEIRREAYWRIQEILNDELPYIFLYTEDRVAALSKDFHGEFSPIDTLYIEEWRLAGDSPQVGGQITFSIGGDPNTLNPLLSTDAMSGTVINQIHSGLLRMNESLEFVGGLASDWTVSEDELTLTFSLHDNVYWHDGVKFTAHDVKFTYDTIMHPDYTGVRKRDFAYVEEVLAPDDNTLVIKLTQPDASLLSKLGIGIIAKHIFEDHPVADLREHPASRATPVGTGPYKLTEWVSGQYLVLERNADYFWGGDYPYLEKIIHRVYQDADATLAALEAGDIDYMGSIPVDSIELIKANHSERLDFIDLKQNGYWYIGMKQDHPIFSDVNVRKALAYGLDRTSMVESLFKGYGTVLNADKPPISWAYNPSLHEYPYDKAKAIEYLENAGWGTLGPDGVRIKK